MKTARRHELQTNELSQQIDELLGYTQQHGWRILTAVVAVVVVVVAIYAFVNSRRSAVANGWAAYVKGPAGSSTAEQIAFYKDLADQDVEPMLTAASLFRAGQVALGESIKPTNSDSQRTDLLKQADGFYSQVTSRYSNLIVPASNARLAVGVVFENKGDFANAKDVYEKLVNEAKLKTYPAGLQAIYRLKNLTAWEPTITFPPPPPASAPASAPAMTAAPTTQAVESAPAEPKPLFIKSSTQSASP